MITESTEQFLSGGGEMGKLIRSMDWSKTALGPVETWPQSLRTSVSLCLSSTFPILIAWGRETIQIYNDSYRPICGAKHPESMGMNFRICWETALVVVGDAFTRGQHGEGTYINDQRMFLDRYGYLEEAWMTFSFAPIRDESGGVGGIFHPITETTVKMLSGRRTQVLRDLGVAFGKAKTVQEIGSFTTERYDDYQLDIPFFIFYQMMDGQAKLISTAGLPEDGKFTEPENWPLSADGLATVPDLKDRFGAFSAGPYEEAPHTALILPVKLSGQETPFGYIVAGVSACRALDPDYLNFYDQLANTFNTAVSNVYAYEQEQKRAEALAAIDRSKTAFFSNVSHEFRTPLTLMLGPLEDLLNKPNLEENIKQPVEATHRNALRLLKLVNNLLDYSRVEAGRAQAAYQQVDLCEMTVDLASSFRSIIEKAGMQLVVDCIPPKDAVFVDRQMWEKIVLNLLSNAFKYTLEGTITVSLKQQYHKVVLEVKDTGVGIPEKELPHMFERFHRVENSAGRTHEGTGIGLSLVNELVQLHGGKISVSSVEGEGSTFSVIIPVGKTHLPQEHVLDAAKITDSSAMKGAFLQEAFNVLQEEAGAAHRDNNIISTGDLTTRQDFSASKETTILIVDDNADMRAYLSRLLEPYFTVQTAINGQDAFKQIVRKMPQLVLTDMMMPVMDGKALLHEIRKHTESARLPVIFLSARAGEEARIDGLEAGADDYLVKPFSAAELLTKIRAQINISQARGLAERRLRGLLTDAPVAIAIYRGANHIIEMANNRMLQYWGRSAEEVTDMPLFDAIPELASQGFPQVMDHVFKTGERFISGEIPVSLTKNGNTETIFMNLTVEALHDDHTNVTGMMAVAADITEQVLSRLELQKASDTLELAMEAAGMGIWKTEWGTDLLEVSPRGRIIHHLPLDKPLSFDETIKLVVPEHRERLLLAITKAVESGGSFSEDYQIQPLNGGNLKWLNTTGKIGPDEQGRVRSVIGTILDITEIKADELRKNDFIGMVSHELKTPLTSLQGFSQLLKMHARKHNDEFSNEKLDKILSQVRKMTTLINGFLDVSRFESGKIHLNKERFDLDVLISEMVDESELSNTKQQLLYNSGVAIEITADRDKIGSVLSNLFSNAIKYSPNKKPVNIIVDQDEVSVTVSIKDEGMGIKPHDLEKLFDRFYRVENLSTKNISGFGIGLYLSAEIIKRHGGHIWATSKDGEGSTFYFQLPKVINDQHDALSH
ncbi:response regulator [Mucilaginibacter terrigena]|uniref:histidine kinase n=1 Tax=Mucilaginibacter terrigena TaxID=2492395 RepID=A0A4Q5LLL4_9SPHI|nr:ATP-binding protein [Mucilaginibacter terrigena]RYU89592.1 response regulator [Mucilaginibacter terrigena]